MRAQFASVAIAATWPLASQIAAVAGRPDLIPWTTAGAVAAIALLAARAVKRGVARSAFVAGGALALVLASVAPAAMMFATPVAMHLALATLFASTLRDGEQPMIERYACREQGGELDEALVSYTRHLTMLWVALFVAMAATAAALAVAAPLATWSWFVNVVAYALIGTFILGEYAVRRVRFHRYRHAPLLRFLRTLAGGFPAGVKR